MDGKEEAHPFKVLIAGGSISGLTLALILEAYNIDYLLLEKHTEIAPFLGTTVGINPNGARILDQLGVYATLDKLGGKQHTNFYYDPEGELLAAQEPIDELMKSLFGYEFCFLNRQDLLRALYNAVKHKSKIKTAAEIVEIVEHESQVIVITPDGSEYRGDILVGADGVRSRVRKELWRISDEVSPGYIPLKDKNAVQSTYSCMTGISPSPDLADKQASRCVNHHRSYVVVTHTGAELCWWLAFFKHDQTLTEANIPRYTVDDHKGILQRYGSDKIGKTTLNKIYDSAHHKVLVPVEEFTLDKWFLGRIVLLGDACHKVHPIIGQGANQAIESAARLADLLRPITNGSIPNSNDVIQDALSRYHATRHPRAVSVMNAGRFSQRVDSLDTAWLKFFALSIATKTPIEDGFLPSFANIVLPAPSLSGLPQPEHGGKVAYEDQIRIKASQRSKLATRVAAFILILVSSCSFYAGKTLKAKYLSSPDVYNDGHSFNSAMQKIAINSLWVIESYRANTSLTLLTSALSFILVASFLDNWQIPLTIYFSLHIQHTSSRDYYYPSPRAIDTGVAISLPFAALIAYGLPVLYHHYHDNAGVLDAKTSEGIAHIVFPILVYLLGTMVLPKTATATIAGAGAGIKTKTSPLVSNFDIPYLRRYYNIIFLVASVAHLNAVAGLPRKGVEAFLNGADVLAEFAPVVLVWAIFVIWDLKRVNILNTGSVIWARAILVMVGGIVLVGPGAMLVVLWRWREVRIEQARKTRQDNK